MSRPASELLFRPEALAAKRHGWLGDISLSQPLSTWVLCGFALLAASSILALMVFGEYTRRSRVVGQLVPDLGLATVVAPVAGVVSAPMPDEGHAVTAGQPLIVVSTARATTDAGDMTAGLLDEIRRRRAGLTQSLDSQSDLFAVQRSGLAMQLRAARLELAQLESAIDVQQKRVGIAGKILDDYRKLHAKTFVSGIQISQQEQAALEQEAALKTLERQAVTLRRNIADIRQAIDELPLQQSVQAAASLTAMAELEQERLQVQAGREVLVAAPLDGLIASRLIERGQSVAPGQPILSLLPSGSELQAQLLVPSRAIGFIAPGDPVVLRYQAFPHQKFGHHPGTVIRISRNSLSPRSAPAFDTGGPSGEPFYRVMVELSAQTIMVYGKPEALLPGMVVEADILGEKRRLYEWLLEPLYSLSGKL